LAVCSSAVNMAKIVPVIPNVNAFSVRMPLDDEFFTATLRWNDRAQRWYMDLADSQGTLLAAGLAVVSDTPLTAHLTHRTGMPRGIFVVVDGTGSGADADFDELGQRVDIVYLEEADLT
jgi:uncharacterized protein DUF6983